MKSPFKSEVLPALAAFLALTFWVTFPARGAKPKEQAAPPPPAAAPQSIEPEISFNGKVFCSLKRRVDLPFKGVITKIMVQSGDRVEAGQVLAKYRLAPEALAQIRQRLAPPQISEGEVRLAETDHALVSLQNQQQELSQLLQKKMAPPKGLEQVNRDLSLANKKRAALQARLRQDRQLAQDDLAVLKTYLGPDVTSGHIPREASLVAPVSGYIIWVHPELQEGAQLEPTPGVLQIGVLDPMLVRAQVFEIEALQIKTGESADITLESLPGHKFRGEVNRVSWSSLTPGLEQPAYYDVELKVPNPDLLLKDGLKAQVVFRKTK